MRERDRGSPTPPITACGEVERELREQRRDVDGPGRPAKRQAAGERDHEHRPERMRALASSGSTRAGFAQRPRPVGDRPQRAGPPRRRAARRRSAARTASARARAGSGSPSRCRSRTRPARRRRRGRRRARPATARTPGRRAANSAAATTPRATAARPKRERRRRARRAARVVRARACVADELVVDGHGPTGAAVASPADHRRPIAPRFPRRGDQERAFSPSWGDARRDPLTTMSHLIDLGRKDGTCGGWWLCLVVVVGAGGRPRARRRRRPDHGPARRRLRRDGCRSFAALGRLGRLLLRAERRLRVGLDRLDARRRRGGRRRRTTSRGISPASGRTRSVPTGGSASIIVCYGAHVPGRALLRSRRRRPATIHVRVVSRSLLGVLSVLDGGTFTAG